MDLATLFLQNQWTFHRVTKTDFWIKPKKKMTLLMSKFSINLIYRKMKMKWKQKDWENSMLELCKTQEVSLEKELILVPNISEETAIWKKEKVQEWTIFTLVSMKMLEKTNYRLNYRRKRNKKVSRKERFLQDISPNILTYIILWKTHSRKSSKEANQMTLMTRHKSSKSMKSKMTMSRPTKFNIMKRE